MKTPILTTALSLLFISPTMAQNPAPGQPPQFRTPPLTTSRGLFGKSAPKQQPAPSAPATRDSNVLKMGEQVPEPVPADEIMSQNLPPLTEPIDAYLLQKEHGPFMVSAYVFQGPEAAKNAQYLAMELRRDYNLPAYVWLARVQPMHSNIRGVQPTAPTYARNGDLAPPEKYRSYDEAAVLVGNCKTIDESEKVLHQVKKIRPTCLNDHQNAFFHRRGKGLYRAMLTTNPFQPSQNLFPGAGVADNGQPIKQGGAFDPYVMASKFEAPKVDDLVRRINSGPTSIFKNNGAYTLQVAEFTGRTVVALSSDKNFGANLPDDQKSLRQSPLVTAAEDAEKLAEAINKCKTANGIRAYTYHSRSSSYVTIGSFTAPNDPAQVPVLNRINDISNELIRRNFSQVALRPSGALMQVPRDTK